MTDLAELPYWLALRRAGLGSRNFALLLAHFKTIGAAWLATPEELARAGIDSQYQRAVAKAQRDFRGEAETAHAELIRGEAAVHCAAPMQTACQQRFGRLTWRPCKGFRARDCTPHDLTVA